MHREKNIKFSLCELRVLCGLYEKCSGELDEIVLKALAKDVEHRFKNANEFLSAIESIKTRIGYIPIPKQVAPSDGKKQRGGNARKKGKGFDEIAGMGELKNILYHDIILPLSDAELYEKYKVSPPNGMLLYGPPGCGKTFISQQHIEKVIKETSPSVSISQIKKYEEFKNNRSFV